MSNGGRRLAVPVGASDHSRGTDTAPVTLVEYGDYQCPYCAKAAPIIDEIRETLGSELRFVFRNLPLRDIHPQAQRAAQAAEAVALQHRFWTMHDLLFEHQRDLRDVALLQYAEISGASVELVNASIDSQEVLRKIDADLDGALKSGASGTPSFYINGASYEDSWDFAPLLERLRADVH
jgi:protein-disulfide isomerase